MRVTDKMLFESATDNALRARERLEKASGELSSGRRMEHPADDPAAAGLMAGARLGANRYQAIRTAVGRATDEINAADGALDQMTNLVTRARELAMQLANGTYSANDRSGGAVEIDSLRQTLIGQLNTQIGRRYIFGGNLDSAPPFDAAGNYLGDTAVRQVEVAPGVMENASVRADVAVKGVGGGTDILAELEALSTALRANDSDAVAATLNGLDSGILQLSRARSDVGASQNVFDAAGAAGREMELAEKKRMSSLGDVDVIEAASRLQLANQALEAALTASAKTFGMTLLDKLG